MSANAFKTIIDIVLNGTVNLTLDVGKRMIKEQTGEAVLNVILKGFATNTIRYWISNHYWILMNLGGVFLAITTHYVYEGSAYVVPSACAKSGVETLMK